MHQHVDRLAGIQSQAAIRAVGAGPEAGDVEGDVGWRQAAWLKIEKDGIHCVARSAAAKQADKGDEGGDAVHISMRQPTGYGWGGL